MLKNDISFELGIRWAEALKKRFPEKNRVKSVAGFFDVEPITARSWLSGQAPYCKYIYMAGQKFGAVFVAEIFMPTDEWLKWTDVDKALSELEEKVCQLCRQIRAIKEDGGP